MWFYRLHTEYVLLNVIIYIAYWICFNKCDYIDCMYTEYVLLNVII